MKSFFCKSRSFFHFYLVLGILLQIHPVSLSGQSVMSLASALVHGAWKISKLLEG